MGRVGKALFRDRTRSRRKRRSQIRRVYRSKSLEAAAKREALQQIYAGLLEVAQQSQQQAARVLTALQEAGSAWGASLAPAGRQAARLAQQLAAWLPRGAQAIDQAWRRMIAGEAVPAAEKLFSLFEPHTQIISRGKAGQQVEFGRKLLVEEVDGGLISGYAVLPTANQDGGHLEESLARHQAQFGQAPQLLTADRGFYSGPNLEQAAAAGVKRVAIPHVGKAPPARQALEKERWFRAGYRWRAGIEGRISLLARRFGLARCRYHGETGMNRWVGGGLLAHNLWQTGRVLAARQAS